jgi:hypothetical protein
MAQAGTSLVTVARFTGHASLEQLRRYIDVSPSDELAALAAIGGDAYPQPRQEHANAMVSA